MKKNFRHRKVFSVSETHAFYYLTVSIRWELEGEVTSRMQVSILEKKDDLDMAGSLGGNQF